MVEVYHFRILGASAQTPNQSWLLLWNSSQWLKQQSLKPNVLPPCKPNTLVLYRLQKTVGKSSLSVIVSVRAETMHGQWSLEHRMVRVWAEVLHTSLLGLTRHEDKQCKPGVVYLQTQGPREVTSYDIDQHCQKKSRFILPLILNQ